VIRFKEINRDRNSGAPKTYKNVPIAIQALTGETLKQLNVTTFR